MARKTPQQVSEKWASRLGQSTQNIVDGIDAVTESPMEKAAAAEGRWQEGVARAAADGRYVRGLQAVSLQDWKEATKAKVSRVASGANQAKHKFEMAIAPVLAAVEAGVDQINRTTPRGDLQQNIARMVQFAEYMHNNARKNT